MKASFHFPMALIAGLAGMMTVSALATQTDFTPSFSSLAATAHTAPIATSTELEKLLQAEAAAPAHLQPMLAQSGNNPFSSNATPLPAGEGFGSQYQLPESSAWLSGALIAVLVIASMLRKGREEVNSHLP